MGAEYSNLIDENMPPQTLSERSLSAVAKHIKDGKARQIVVMTGAGLSTAAGIPDFRSPNTGLYANLARLNLPFAEAVFDISYFRGNPDPFYVLAKELYPGNYSPTISHVFISLLAKKGLLCMLFTQNIDCLERQAGVPGDLIVEAHGSFATQRCIECKKEFPDDRMKEHVFKGEVPRCTDDKCNGLVKPDIVFFGEALPEAFFNARHVPGQADMAFIMGTSLTVHPFAGLPDLVRETCPRVLFNMERVGSLGTQADDVLVLGDCDTGVRKLAEELGWADELEAEWRRVVGEKEAARQLRSAQDRQAELKDEVEDLAGMVGEVLKIDGDSGAGEGAAAGRADEDENKAVSTSPTSKKPTNATTDTVSQEDGPQAVSDTKDKPPSQGDNTSGTTSGTTAPTDTDIKDAKPSDGPADGSSKPDEKSVGKSAL